MSDGFKTELPTMQAAAQHVYDVNAQIQGQLTSLLTRLEPLAGAWQGSAAGSFTTLKQRWHDEATKLNALLREIGDGLQRTHGNYATSEQANTDGFTRMTGSL